MKNSKKIFLVINAGYFGDVILTSKLTRDIKKEYPDSKVVFVPDTPYESVAKGLPGVDEVICYDRKSCQNFKGVFNFWKNFPYKCKIDVAFLPHARKANRVFLAQFLGAKKIITLSGYKIPKECKDLVVKNPSYQRFTCEAANMFSVVSGKLTDNQDIEYIVPKECDDRIESLLSDLNQFGNLVAINPQAGDDWKCWDVDETVKFVKMLMKDGKKVVLTGVSKDGSVYSEALDKEIGADNYLNFIDKTTTGELGALYKRCEAVISVDTGSMHMACAVGTPTVALFFRDNAYFWAPFDNEKNPYIYNPDGISAQSVYSEVQNIFKKKCQAV